MLSRLEIRGFKSFAQPVTLTFGPGVNVVVGPNGSGKSNLSEAVSWAMGEQRAARLRAPSMGDVIFSGGRNAGPSGFAEVRMAFGASDGAEEVELSRRLTRAGDSDYRLNGSGCRLLDVQDELSARGLGPDSLAIIRQGQVEAICAAKPADLRAMLDEAAGVGVAKRRRRRAEQKLVRVSEKLDRARDITEELAGRNRSLSRQAKAAERAAEVEASVEAAREALRAAIAASAHEELARARKTHAQMVVQRDSAAVDADRARTARDEREAARAAALNEIVRAEALVGTLRSARERCDSRREIGGERIVGFLDRIGRQEEERQAAAAELADLDERLAAATSEATEAHAVLTTAEAELRALEQVAVERGRARDGLAEALEDQVRSHARLEREARESVAELERCTAAHSSALQRLATVRDGVGPDEARLERRATLSRQRAERRAEELAQHAAALEDARARTIAAAEGRRAAQSHTARLGRARQRADAGSLGAELRVAAGMEQAVAAALGALADAPVVKSVAGGVEAIDAGSTAAVVPAPQRERSAAPAQATHLLDVVEAFGSAKVHVERLLADCFLIGSLDDVPAGARGCFVTSEGHALRADTGIVSGAASDWATSALLARAQGDLAAAEQVLGLARAVEAQATERHAIAQRRGSAANRCAAQAEQRLTSSQQERARRAAAIAEAERMVAEHDAARVSTLARREAIDERLAAVGAAPNREPLAQAVREAEAAASMHAAANQRVASLRSTRDGLHARLSEITTRRAAVEVRSGQPARDIPDLTAARAALDSIESVVGALDEAASAQAENAVHERSALTDIDVRLQAARQAVLQREAAHSTARDQAHSAEVALAVAAERASEAGAPPPPGTVIEGDLEVLAAKLASTERQRAVLGVVNPLAAEELKETAAREREISEQVVDLAAAADALATHLAEMDRAVSAGFEQTFASVSEQFSMVVDRFFPGGEGHLSIVPPAEDGDEPGIEVAVVPSGKRSRALSLMSGGERSLVALAFLLALAMSRPAPVYMLDEVEAALDDVNLRRFLGAIKSLSTQTQFIVITHQQPTVEIADALFGITMGGDGVSQVVSRRLSRTVEGPARPYVRRALQAVPGGRSA